MSEIETFEIGDEVILKSGGNVMIVKDILDGSYVCYWEDDAGNHQESTFKTRLLTKYVETTLGEDDAYIG